MYHHKSYLKASGQRHLPFFLLSLTFISVFQVYNYDWTPHSITWSHHHSFSIIDFFRDSRINIIKLLKNQWPGSNHDFYFCWFDAFLKLGPGMFLDFSIHWFQVIFEKKKQSSSEAASNCWLGAAILPNSWAGHPSLGFTLELEETDKWPGTSWDGWICK